MQMLHIIFDDSALVAAGRGNALASALIAQAHPMPARGQDDADPDEEAPIARIYVAACALVEAERTRPGTGAHIAALPNLEVLPLDLAAALPVADSQEWAASHTLHAARPSPELPEGAVVATTRPEEWAGRPVRVLDLSP
ncbi:hypothetical protein Kisp01_20140 [Kineosporia sp. NBRC 101677]|nr:hypothetical protein [Kineosporia sp. NBRC 101677]GLY14999.1 hypothetical protein Kisp01_20140 [Kineosporia sp. NBRC 101677]